MVPKPLKFYCTYFTVSFHLTMLNINISTVIFEHTVQALIRICAVCQHLYKHVPTEQICLTWKVGEFFTPEFYETMCLACHTLSQRGKCTCITCWIFFQLCLFNKSTVPGSETIAGTLPQSMLCYACTCTVLLVSYEGRHHQCTVTLNHGTRL